MPAENIRLSQTGRNQLIQLKRHTRIANWNVLCRWAYCLSLAEQTQPRHVKVPADSSVEMTWRTFGGDLEEIYRGLAMERSHREGRSEEVNDADLFRLHLHRGIGYLAGDRRVKTIAGLLRLAVSQEKPVDVNQSQNIDMDKDDGALDQDSMSKPASATSDHPV